jgi:hypothetical protein
MYEGGRCDRPKWLTSPNQLHFVAAEVFVGQSFEPVA